MANGQGCGWNLPAKISKFLRKSFLKPDAPERGETLARVTVFLRGVPLCDSKDRFVRYSIYGIHCPCPIKILLRKNQIEIGQALSGRNYFVDGVEYLEFECKILDAYLSHLHREAGRYCFAAAHAVGAKGIHLRDLYLRSEDEE